MPEQYQATRWHVVLQYSYKFFMLFFIHTIGMYITWFSCTRVVKHWLATSEWTAQSCPKPLTHTANLKLNMCVNDVVYTNYYHAVREYCIFRNNTDSSCQFMRIENIWHGTTAKHSCIELKPYIRSSTKLELGYTVIPDTQASGVCGRHNPTLEA